MNGNMKEAQFIDTITPAKYEYQEQKFTFDFGGTGVFIADAFDDIIDFIVVICAERGIGF